MNFKAFSLEKMRDVVVPYLRTPLSPFACTLVADESIRFLIYSRTPQVSMTTKFLSPVTNTVHFEDSVGHSSIHCKSHSQQAIIQIYLLSCFVTSSSAHQL